jgi:hypothetical protein
LKLQSKLGQLKRDWDGWAYIQGKECREA